MKSYSVIYIGGEPHLREQNPLADSQHLVSAEAYQTHEAQYVNDALLFLNASKSKRVYSEEEVFMQWQKLENKDWINVTEPDFIGTDKTEYRRVYLPNKPTLTYQERVKDWIIECFDEQTARNVPERSLRFLEEALELSQSMGLTRENVYRLVTHVYGRPEGEPKQEVGGVMVTLAGLCAAADIDLNKAAENEYKRIINSVDAIRKKHKEKQLINITA